MDKKQNNAKPAVRVPNTRKADRIIKTRRTQKLKGMIGFCTDDKLFGGSATSGHYVYIRDVQGDTCDVNTVTSIEDFQHRANFEKVRQVKNGNTYPIPVYDATFNRWSGVTRNAVKGIKVADLNAIGVKKIKRRHRFMIDKYYE